METVIQAKVNQRLLSKADRLFTGTLDGRIIEILQNSRRAGATEVIITNKDGLVTVRDNGCGIEDFSKLLDLGDSDWDPALEEAEDPAGVGIFCLAPRKVTICSNTKKITIDRDGWTGKPIKLERAEGSGNGTVLTFADEPWELSKVQKHAVFSGLKVMVDGKTCPQQRFTSSRAVHHPELGCKIEVRERDRLSEWHNHWRDSYYCDVVLVNFHGQVVKFPYDPVSENLVFLVDMTGEPTGIRMLLPARTQLIENKAFKALKAAIETEAYRFIQKRGTHKLRFEEYKRAEELGIKLPEAEPVFDVGLLSGDTPEPIQVIKPKDLPLSKCYRLGDRLQYEDECSAANVHLLATLGKFDEPFVPVNIARAYDGYNWARLPTVDKIEVKFGKELARDWVWSQVLVAVESIRITAKTSDSRVLDSDVVMAVAAPQDTDQPWCGADHVYVMPAAREQLSPSQIWFHLGGWSDEGDMYDTQEYQFEEQLELFWAKIAGPGEYLRRKLVENIDAIKGDWRTITIDPHGTVVIAYKDGSAKTLKSPFNP
jgi:hypothetical protein